MIAHSFSLWYRCVLLGASLLLPGSTFAMICDDDGTDSSGALSVNILNSACVNGKVRAGVTDAGGGGVNLPADASSPASGYRRQISGSNTANFVQGAPFSMPVHPGQEMKVDWSVVTSPGTTDSLHTLVEPTDMPEGYKVQVNKDDGEGWVNGNKLDRYGPNINLSTVNYRFRIVRPIREPGHVTELMLTRPKFLVKHNDLAGTGDTDTKVVKVDVDGATGAPDVEIPKARFVMALGAALEDGKPVSAGDLVLDMSLWNNGGLLANRNKLCYEGVDRTKTGVEVISSSGIRQVRAPQVFIDVVTINAGGNFEIRLYPPSAVEGQTPSPLYSPTGSPYTIWSVLNFSGVDDYDSGISLSEDRDGVTVRKSTMEIDRLGSTTTLSFRTRRTDGAGSDPKQIEIMEHLTSLVPNNTQYSIGGGIKTIGGMDAESTYQRSQRVTVARNAATISQTTELYLFANRGMGEGILERSQLTQGTTELVTKFWHIWTQIDKDTYSSPIGKPLLEYYPDGSWERYLYDGNGRQVSIVRPYEGTPTNPWTAAENQSVVETFSYAGDPVTAAADEGAPGSYVTSQKSLPQSTEIKIKGTTVSKTMRIYSASTSGGEPVLQTQTQDYRNASAYQQTLEEHYHETASGVPANMPISRTLPAGEKRTYAYERGTFDRTARTFATSSTGLDLRTTVTWGTTASPAGIANKTKRTQTITNPAATVLQETTQIYSGSTYETATVTDYAFDIWNRLIETRQDGRIIQSITYSGLSRTVTDEEGVAITTTYDTTARAVSEAKAGGPTTNHAYSGNLVTTTSGDLSSSRQVDAIGREITSTDVEEKTVSTTYAILAAGGSTTTKNFHGASVIETFKPGGRLASITGSKMVKQYLQYGLNTSDGSQSTKVSQDTSTNARWTQTTVDWLQNEITFESPAPSATPNGTVVRTRTYGTHGLLAKESFSANAQLAPRLYEYDSRGELYREGRDYNGNGTLDPGSTDPIVEHDKRYEKIDGEWYGVLEMRQYQGNNSSVPATVQITRSRLSALSGGSAAKVMTLDANGVTTTAVQTIDRSTKTVTTVTSKSDRTDTETEISINGLIVSRQNSRNSLAETYQYDSLERLWKTTDARTAVVTTRTYNDKNQLTQVQDHLGRTTGYVYFTGAAEANAGRLKEMVNADGKSTYYSYNTYGQLLRTWGAAANPEERTYDNYGALTKTSSYRAGTSPWTAATWPATAGARGPADTTTYNYYPGTGLLSERIDAKTRKTTYKWHDNGQLQSRKVAAVSPDPEIETTWSYDASGFETARSYNGGVTTPNLTFTRDRAGRVGTLVDGSGTRTYAYTSSGLMKSVAVSGGVLAGFSSTFDRDGYGRHTSTTITSGGATRFSETRTYESGSGRLAKVNSSNIGTEYLYTPNSNLPGQVLWRKSGTILMGQLRTYDTSDRISSIQHIKGPAAGGPLRVASHEYEYDVLDRREKTSLADGSFWEYDYNDRSELTLADKKLSGGASFYAGQQFRFTYDNAGNRLTKQSGGDSAGSGRRTFTSTANELNQRASQSTPATFDISGSSPAATVTVNGVTAARQGAYFHSQITVTNSSAAAWSAITVQDGTTTTNGNVLVAPANPTITYDSRGNLTSDGVWVYTWDAENRLVKAVRNISGIPYREIRNVYDGNDRLIQRQVFHASGGAAVVTEKYLHEGTRRLLTVDASNQAIQSFHWGLDASLSPDGAAGAGGLLWIDDHATSTVHFVCTDANANVTHLVNASNYEVSASYEYSPFGELLRMTGSYAATNPFRFSTKPQDDLTGLLNYGARHYKPDWGAWLSQDPYGDIDGFNRYGFVGNDPINGYDVNGYFLSTGEQAYLSEMLNPLSWARTAAECIVDPNYYEQVGNNFYHAGKGFVDGAKGVVDGVQNIPEIAKFIGSGQAAELVRKLRDDPDFREAMAKELGKDFCQWLKHVSSNDGFFEELGQKSFDVLSGAAFLKLIKAAQKVKALGKFAKKLPKPEAAKIVRGPGTAANFGSAEFAEEIVNNPIANKSYAALQRNGIDVQLYREANNGFSGSIENGVARVNLAYNPTVKEAASTMIHEAKHARLLENTGNAYGLRGRRAGEYSARALEHFYQTGSRPNAAQRAFIKNDIIDLGY